MGYRHYFYLVDKSEVEKVRDMDMKSLTEYAKQQGTELFEEDGGGFYFDDNAFMNKTEVFEFGKLYWDDTAERIYKTGLPLFSRPEVQNEFEDYIPFVVGKSGLLEAIKIYQEKALAYYKGLKVDDEDDFARLTSEQKIKEHIQGKIKYLSHGIANLDESKQWCVSNSWEYENAVFNLVHLLKVIDWSKQTLLFYGW